MMASINQNNCSRLHMEFEDITVRIGDKYILQNVCAEVKPGEVLALMGSSGAGKTSLMNVICGRYNGMKMEKGEVLLNGMKSSKLLRRRIGYIVQEDIFLPHLTVQQTLNFAGNLLIPDTLPKESKKAIINNAIDELSLHKCLSTVMGDGMFSTGCSGGERKRVSIALELIRNPDMLILDEPTTGLDASNATSLIKCITNLAKKQNHSVIISIHQPSSHVFHMFNKVLLLSNGEVAYYGRTDRVLDFFGSIGLRCYPNWNPADYVLDKLSEGVDGERKIVDAFNTHRNSKNSSMYLIKDTKKDPMLEEELYSEKKCLQDGLLDNKHEITNFNNGFTNPGYATDQIINGGSNIIGIDTEIDQEVERVDPPNNPPKWPTGLKTQISSLCRRAFIQTRNNVFSGVGFSATLIVTIASSLIWFNTPYNEESIKDRMGLMFFLAIHTSFSQSLPAAGYFLTELKNIDKERASGMYRLSAFLIGQDIADIPVVTFQPLLGYTVIYWAAGFNRSPVFLLGMFAMVTECILVQTVGYLFAAVMRNPYKAFTSTNVFNVACSLLGGYFTVSMPVWIGWARFGSHISYLYNIFQRLEFEYASVPFDCSLTDTKFDTCRGNGTKQIQGADIHIKYPYYLDLSIAESFLILWFLILVYKCLLYISLRFVKRS